MLKLKEIWILGCALFALFFGAGNLIFPPYLGFQMGSNWLAAAIGFLLTAVGLPLLGIISFTKYKSLDDFAVKVSPIFNTIFCSILILIIGPLFAIPRTGSTTFELAILSFFQSSSFVVLFIMSVIFFALTYFLTINENKIIDVLGKYLTPIILGLLIIMFIRGLTLDLGTQITTDITTNIFQYGFINGYQTMDALASILFGVLIIHSLQSKGITDSTKQQAYLIRAGIIASIGLGVVYLCLIYFGSFISDNKISSTTSVSLYMAEMLVGSFGRSLFGITVGAACLTTAVGLTALTAEWFSKLTKISYHNLVIIICVFSSLMAIGGVDMIITLSIPVLSLLYPVTIVLIIMNIIGLNSIYFKFGTYTTLIISLIEILGSTFNIQIFKQLIQRMPLGTEGFVWVLPFFISLFVARIISRVFLYEKV